MTDGEYNYYQLIYEKMLKDQNSESLRTAEAMYHCGVSSSLGLQAQLCH